MKRTSDNAKQRETSEIVLPLLDLGDTAMSKWIEGLAQANIQTQLEYIDIAKNIVGVSEAQLYHQNKSKGLLRGGFTPYFKWLIVIQLLFLGVLLMLKGFCPCFHLNDVVIITYITSVFVETLGGVIVMVTYAFNSKEEVEATKILTGVIEHYQK